MITTVLDYVAHQLQMLHMSTCYINKLSERSSYLLKMSFGCVIDFSETAYKGKMGWRVEVGGLGGLMVWFFPVSFEHLNVTGRSGVYLSLSMFCLGKDLEEKPVFESMCQLLNDVDSLHRLKEIAWIRWFWLQRQLKCNMLNEMASVQLMTFHALNYCVMCGCCWDIIRP